MLALVIYSGLLFRFFMEKQIMGEFARILRISKLANVALQLLQTMSIMIQNLKNEHSICKAISGKLNKNTISLLVKTEKEEVVFFPLYVEAIRFAFHDENMVRIAVRALTLNVYHGKLCHFLLFYRKQDASDSSSSILDAVDDIEDNLYYFSDVISAGVPDLGRLLTDNILLLLVFPLLLPSLKKQNAGTRVGTATSLYLLCSILHIFKTKDLASTIAASLFCPLEAFVTRSEATTNGYVPQQAVSQESEDHAPSLAAQVNIEDSECTSTQTNHFSSQSEGCGSHITLR
ncbi:hypothetical protein GW17_00026469 [Ensete ventricosum]|nr:hypothetical protein GW17_00026469 [Ensete ventricosum]RZS16958.1 hypothetical protein BHM03_00049037 [Ensete ventricosum]